MGSRYTRLSLTNIFHHMLIIFKQGMSKAQIAALWKKLRMGRRRRKQKAVPDIRQFCGVIKLKEDPLVIQKRMRDEWR